MDRAKQRIISRKKRSFRIRKKTQGTEKCPRLCINRSLKHISAQIIDDTKGTTLVSASTLDKELAKNKGTKTDLSKIVGELIAERALEKGIKKVVFDRRGYPYHGCIKAFAESSRKKGLEF
jgi:large subunit ribosomal protein L18